MKGILSLIALLTLASKGSAVIMDFTDCGTQGIIYYLDINGCDNDYEGAEPPASEKCIVSRGGYLHGESQFEAGFEAEYMDCEIFAFIDGVEVSFPGSCTPTGDVCLDLAEGECPIEAGEVVIYLIDMDVLQSYPTFDGQVQWTLLDENEDLVYCFEINLSIAA